MSRRAIPWAVLVGPALLCAAQQAGCLLDAGGTGPQPSEAGAGAAGGGGNGVVTTGSGGSGPSSSTGGGEGGHGASGGGGSGGVEVPGYSLRFSSADESHVDVGDLVIPKDFTVEAWVKRAAGGGSAEQCLLAKDQSNQAASQLRLMVESSGRVAFMMSNASSQDGGLYQSGYRVRSMTALPEEVWTHVAVAKGGTMFRLHINGTQEAFHTASQDLTHGGAQPLRIGSRVGTNGTAPDDVFDGQIDEVRVWSVSRTEAEIQGAMAQTLDPAGPGAAGLLASYRFDEGTGTTAEDQLGAHPGTLVKSPEWVEDDAAP